MTLPVLVLGAAAFVVSLIATRLMISLAPKWGFVDNPGGRKVHDNPKPLLGGVGIFAGFALPLIVALLVAACLPSLLSDRIPEAYLGGIKRQMPLAIGLVVAMLAVHLLGVIDDRKALGPYLKLTVQLAITIGLVWWFDLRALTTLDKLGMGTLPSIVVTVLWITAITNAFNFLDNMDGLSAGVGAVCCTAFLVTTILIQQWFVAASLALLLGSLLGFLVWNFPPARIFMGDCGSMIIGFVMGVLTVRTTFLPKDVHFGAGWYAVFAPVIVLALPLYDLIVVSIIRISRGKSPFVGDTNHFSHRLVARGMSKRTAVLCLYLVTAATSVSAILLPWVQSQFAAILIFCQTLLILCLVALLEQHPLPNDP